MKYISPLSEKEQNTLESAYKNHPSGRVRNRALMLILSNQGYHVNRIADIFQITRQTVSSLINNWETSGPVGLYDSPRSGRPPVLNSEDKKFVSDIIKQEPRSAKKIIAELEDKRGKKVSGLTIKRVLKKGRLRWKRIRKSLKPKRNEDKFRAAQQKIRNPEERQSKGEIEVYYYDEAGFSQDPSVPYAWQPTGETTEIPAAKGQRLNVAGIMNKNNELTPYTFRGNADSSVVVGCLNDFAQNIRKKTFVIMDNAPTHKSREFVSHLPGWAKLGLLIKFLPSYSPELNLTEILWKKMKYEWLPFSAYLSFKNLVEAVENILANFGSEFKISFSS